MYQISDPVNILKPGSYDYTNVLQHFEKNQLSSQKYRVLSVGRISNEGIAARFGQWFREALQKVDMDFDLIKD